MRKIIPATVLFHSVALLTGAFVAAACVIWPSVQAFAPTHEHVPAEVAFLEAAAECAHGERFAHTYGNAVAADPRLPHTYSTSITALGC